MSTRRKAPINLTAWKKMMEGAKKTTRAPYPYETMKTERNKKKEEKEKELNRIEKEMSALRVHAMLRKKYGYNGDNAAVKIQRAFKSIKKDYHTLRKKQDERRAKEVENLLENFLKPERKRSRNNNIPPSQLKRRRKK